MRLNALSPSENPMDQLLYCFGGDDGGGGEGGGMSEKGGPPQSSSKSTPSTTDDAYGPGNQQTGQGSDPGFDEGDTGDTGGFDAGFDDGDTGDTGGFGGPSGDAGAAGSNIDSLIEQSLATGYGPNIQSTDLPSQAEVSAAMAAGIPGVQAQTTGFTAPSVAAGLTGRAPGSMARDTSIEQDLFGGDEYTTQDIFEADPTGLGFETPQEQAARQRQETTRAAARAAAAMQATEEAQRQAQMAALGVSPQDRALQAELDAQNALAEQARQEEEDALSAQLGAEVDARGARTSAPEARGIDSLMGGTVFGAPDVTGQAQDIGMGQTAAVPGIVGGVRGTPDATQQAADAALAATTGGVRDITDAQGNVIGVERSVNLGGGISQAELDAARAEGKAAQAAALDQRAQDQQERAAAAAAVAAERTVNGVPVTDLSVPAIDREPVFDPTVEVTDLTAPRGPAPVTDTAERAVIEGRDPRAPDYTLEEAQANLEAARAEAYADKQFGFDTGLPSSVNILGANIPTGVGVVEGIADALFDPEASVANAIAERGIRSVDGQSAEGSANYNPQGLDVVTSGGPVTEGGRTAAYDPSNNVVYDTSPFSGLNPFGEGVPDNIQDLYNRQRQIDDAERARQGGDGGQEILPPLIEEPIIPVPEEEFGMDMGEYQYQPMGPVQYSYTGLPTLAPFVLRPTRQASRNIRPTYDFGGLGSLRRS